MVRGREIYDPATNAWYWLDSVYNGAKAVGKEVWIPYIYQGENSFSESEIIENANASDEGLREFAEKCIRERTGKWVRYDENGRMLKGWVKIEGALADCYPDQAGNVYYYDNKTGLMAKGYITLDGRDYHFDEITGVLDKEKEQEKEKEQSSVTVTPQVLYDKKNIKITATGMGEGYSGQTLKLLIENNSGRDIIVQDRDTSVNGYMCDSYLQAEVEKGTTAEDGLEFLSYSLEECGIDKIATMEFYFDIANASNWSTMYTSGVIKVDTSIAGSYQQPYDASGRLLVNKNGVRIVDKGLALPETSTFGTGVTLYIENNTDKKITVQVRDVYVNGYPIDAIIAEEVVASKKARSEVIFMEYSMDDYGIKDIHEVKMYFNILNTDSGDTLFDSDVVTLQY